MKSVKKFFLALLEGIQDAKNYKAKGLAEYYLSKSIDHGDLETKQKELLHKGILWYETYILVAC